MPRFGTSWASEGILATRMITDYWSWDSNGAEPEARFWKNENSSGPTDITVNMSRIENDMQAQIKVALDAWEDVANIHFTITQGSADITYIDSGLTAGTQPETFFDGLSGKRFMTHATVDIPRDFADGVGDGNWNYFYQSILHETGHALGLGHTGNYNFDGEKGKDYYNTDETIWANDTWQMSVMSYNEQSNWVSRGSTDDFVLTPQMADINAIQRLYGAAVTRTDSSVYGFHSNVGSFYDFAHYTSSGNRNAAPAFTIYDSGGNDTLDCSGFKLKQTINLQGGSFSSVGDEKNNVGIYTTSVIENAVGGSGSDTITGNNVANVITGGAGFDRMTGLSGADTFIFFKGDTSSTRSTADTITDFRHSDSDIIDFTHRDANSVLSGDQAFTFIGNQSFHKVAGELHYIQEGSDTWIEGDTNGNARADFIIHLTGSVPLVSTDFHL